MACRVVFFKTPSGREPTLEFIQQLDREDRQVIGFDLRTVQDGFPIEMPVCRPLGAGLYEVRSSLPSRREARVLFFVEGSLLVVVHGFIKKTGSTPPEALKLARERKGMFEANGPTSRDKKGRRKP